MPFCNTTVHRAGDADNEAGEEAASGSTDSRGHFAFVPDGPGPWRITVDDGMGHRETVVWARDPNMANDLTCAPGATGGCPAGMLRTLCGVGLLFGVFGAWSLLRASVARQAGARFAAPGRNTKDGSCT